MESMHQEEIAPYFNTRDRLQAKVLVAAGEAAYRRAVQSNVKPGDRILEIGCHVGVTTEKLRLAVGESGTVIGIDASEISISRARTRFPEAHFVVMDGFDMQGLLSFGVAFNKIFVDISGNRELIAGSDTVKPIMGSKCCSQS